MTTTGSTRADETPDDAGTPAPAAGPSGAALAAAGLLAVVVLTVLARLLEKHLPDLAPEGSDTRSFLSSIEYPVYAILAGLLGNALLSSLGVRDRIAAGFRTELLIKTGLVLLGASINIAVVARAAGPAIAQSVLLISVVFGFAWWLGGRLGLDDKLRALLAAAVSICGVSAAIAAAGAVQAKKEQLAYSASLVILFALPSIFLLPYLADALGLSAAVAGAWIGGNIDTTAAVTAAGAVAGEDVLAVAAIVKSTQNALLGVVAVGLTAYFTLKVERVAGARRPGAGELWRRFPKFVLGFLAASVIATVFLEQGGDKEAISVVNDLRTWFLALAFVSIGLEFRVKGLREAGWRPVLVFGAATVVNLVVALALASVLFRDFVV